MLLLLLFLFFFVSHRRHLLLPSFASTELFVSSLLVVVLRVIVCFEHEHAFNGSYAPTDVVVLHAHVCFACLSLCLCLPAVVSATRCLELVVGVHVDEFSCFRVEHHLRYGWLTKK